MKKSIKKGFSFGLTSAIITTLGLIIGLNSTTHSRSIVIGGILTIAVADALSDALGVHISEEASSKKITKKQVWEATISTLLSKFIFAITFLVPVLLLKLDTAIIVSIIWGLFLISIFSYYIAKSQNASPYKALLEHLVIAGIVIVITHNLGLIIGKFFA
ncbi:hypothetical protein GOV14_04280 [Candidatus Pacearchaeota archaeon]|nr:hypothetical protein [Candidatus Pacearchaeota archaeon]